MTMHAAYSPGSHRSSAVAIRLAVAMAIAGCAVAIGACGSSGGGQPAAGATTATGNASPLALSHCMRAHGISNFPDPSNGGLTILASPGSATLTVAGIVFSGPALQKAEQACRRYLVADGPPVQPSAAQKAEMVALARCMRANGVPSFADPSPGPIGTAIASKRPSASFESPAFRHAISVCGTLRKR
jgi:hypothetical protein